MSRALHAGLKAAFFGDAVDAPALPVGPVGARCDAPHQPTILSGDAVRRRGRRWTRLATAGHHRCIRALAEDRGQEVRKRLVALAVVAECTVDVRDREGSEHAGAVDMPLEVEIERVDIASRCPKRRAGGGTGRGCGAGRWPRMSESCARAAAAHAGKEGDGEGFHACSTPG